MKKKTKLQYSNILAIVFIIASIYLIQAILLFKKIETGIRYFIIGVILIIDILIFVKLFFSKKKKKKKKKIIASVVFLVFSILFIFLGYNLNKIYSYFSNLNKKVVYSISLVTLKENKITDPSKLKDVKIGVNTEEEHKLAEDIIKKYALDKNNELVEYQDYRKMILDLYDGKVQYIFLQTNYVDIYSTDENFENIGEKIITIDTSQKEVTKEEVQLSGSSKDVSEPFTVLLIGIDSTVNGLQNADSFNGDSLIVVTFNPSTMHATMLSIPRDSYVPITCMGGIDNKITHSASGGAKCVINTIQNFLDIKIDYYMKINFTGVVDLVNAVGGIEVDVPYKICEQNSKRQFGKKMVYINAGHQTLNGEQALAYARNRKSNSNYCSKEWTTGVRNDFVRAEHQQEVIQAILNKMKNFSSIGDLEKILSVISKNFDTNMSESTIFSFYNIGKDVLLSSSSDSVITIDKLYLDGDGQMIFDERSGLVLWDYILNQRSLSEVKQALKNNLSGKKQELIKSFSYKYGENYSVRVIGKGYYDTKKYTLLPDMTGWTLTKAQKWLKDAGLTVEVQYTESNKENNIVLEQQYPASKRIDLIPNKKVILKIARKGGSSNTNQIDCLIDEENEKCIVPDFVGKNVDYFNNWAGGFSNMLDYKPLYEETSAKPANEILKQSVESGTTVSELLNSGKTLYITYAIAPKENNENTNTTTNTTDPSGGDPNTNTTTNTTPDPTPNTNETPGGNENPTPGTNETPSGNE